MEERPPIEKQSPVKFSEAVKKLKKKINKFGSEVKEKEPELKSPIFKKVQPRLLRFQRKKPMLRLNSYSYICISEESDEENEHISHNTRSFLLNGTESAGGGSTTQQVGIKKTSSVNSFASSSNMSSSSALSTGFWRKSHRRGKNHPKFQSRVDQIRYHKQRKYQLLTENNNIFKRRKEKLNLDFDIKWNSAHDEEFFRCLERYMDEAIA